MLVLFYNLRVSKPFEMSYNQPKKATTQECLRHLSQSSHHSFDFDADLLKGSSACQLECATPVAAQSATKMSVTHTLQKSSLAKSVVGSASSGKQFHSHVGAANNSEFLANQQLEKMMHAKQRT
jgi:hypothetical protein